MKKIKKGLILVVTIFFIAGCNAEELAKKDKTIQELTKENTEAKLQNKDLANQILLKDQEIQFLKQMMEKNNKDLEEVKAKLQKLENLEKDYAVLESQKKNSEQLAEEKIKNLENEKKDKDNIIKKLEEESKKIADENLKLKAELEKQKQEIASLKEELKKQKEESSKKEAMAFASTSPDKVKALENQVKMLEDQLVLKNKEIEMLKKEITDLKKLQEEIKKESTKLKETFKKEIESGDIIVEDSMKKINVIMMEQVLFRKAEISLTPQGEKALRKIANALKEIKNKEIFVVGHADSDPVTDPIIKKIFPTNWEFSVMRAVMVVRYLTEILEMNPVLFTAAGRSYYHPIKPETNEKNKSMNRRTEILIFPIIETTKQEEKEEKKTEKK